MTKFSNFDRQNLKALRSEMDALLKKYGVDSNLEITVGNMKFTDAEVEIKVKAKIKGAKTFSNTILETRAAALGVKLKNSRGDELIDYNTRAHKMPFIYRCGKTGKMFKCDSEVVKVKFAA